VLIWPASVLCGVYRRLWNISTESRICVFDDAALAVLLDRPVALDGNRTVLDIQLLETATIICDTLHPAVRDHVAAAQAELLQVRTALGQSSKPRVAHIALPDVQGSQTWTGSRQDRNGVIAHGLTSSSVQIAQLIAPPGNHL